MAIAHWRHPDMLQNAERHRFSGVVRWKVVAYLLDMTVSIRVMTAGDGYRYLLNSVVTGDGDRDAAYALTRYYLESGTPLGTWTGSGLVGLPGGVAAGTAVSEEQLRRLMGFGQDPNSGEQLGRPYRKFATAAERVDRRVEKLSGTSPTRSVRSRPR